MNKKIFILILIFSFFGFIAKAEGNRVEVPDTIDAAKIFIMDLIRAGREDLPKNMKSTWENEVLPVWGRMYDWYKTNIWSRVQEGIKLREPAVKEAFDKEKGEMAEDIKKEAPKFSEYLKFLWQEFKNLFQLN